MSSTDGSSWPPVGRRLGFEQNPLRRPSDRVQARTRIFLFGLFVVGCVIAAFSGHTAYEQEAARAQVDARSGYHTEARVLSTTLSAADPQSGATQRVVRISWRDPQGKSRQQRLVVPERRHVRPTMSVWVNGEGRASMTRPPQSRTVATGLGAGFLVVFASAFLLTSVYGVVVLALNRGRMKAWQREWRLVEPDWRKRVL